MTPGEHTARHLKAVNDNRRRVRRLNLVAISVVLFCLTSCAAVIHFTGKAFGSNGIFWRGQIEVCSPAFQKCVRVLEDLAPYELNAACLHYTEEHARLFHKRLREKNPDMPMLVRWRCVKEYAV